MTAGACDVVITHLQLLGWMMQDGSEITLLLGGSSSKDPINISDDQDGSTSRENMSD
jgi:hypothetical protein